MPTGPAPELEEPPESTSDAGKALDSRALIDVGPAGPATAHRSGVVMVDKSNTLRLAELKTQAKGGYTLEPLDVDADELAPYARGPSVQGEHAYWVDHGKLVRRSLKSGKLETLTSDARDATRVSTAPGPIAAYIAKSGEDLVARLWSESATLTLSPEGSTSHSVALAGVEDRWVAVYQEVRTAMSPLHARPLELGSGKPSLGQDTVIWVGASGQPLTEVATAAADGELWALVAMEKDIVSFGLARVRVGPEPKVNSPVSWRLYPNGSDPSPVTAANACRSSLVAYSRPAAQAPRSPQELHLAGLRREGLGPSALIARSRAFSNISLASLDGAVLVVYVADYRTWAAIVPCEDLPKPG